MYAYIEQVLIDNFFITMLLAVMSYRALGIKSSKLRIALASILATAVSVAFPLLDIHALALLAIRAALFIILSLILFCKKSKLITSAITFLLLTFTFGGALFAVGLFIHGSVERALTLPAFRFPPGIIIGGGFLMYFIVKRVIAKFKRAQISQSLTAPVEVEIFSKKLAAVGFLDTGNLLFDTKTDLPVVIFNAKLSLQVLGDNGLSALLRERLNEIQGGAHYMYYSGVDGTKHKMLILIPQKFVYYIGDVAHKIEGVAVGLVLSKYGQFSEKFDCLLHPAIMQHAVLAQKNQQKQVQS